MLGRFVSWRGLMDGGVDDALLRRNRGSQVPRPYRFCLLRWDGVTYLTLALKSDTLRHNAITCLSQS
jgi:hypothetical protein